MHDSCGQDNLLSAAKFCRCSYTYIKLNFTNFTIDYFIIRNYIHDCATLGLQDGPA